MREVSGMSFITISSINRAASEVATGIKVVSDFWKSCHLDYQKRKGDPFSPALRSKGEKARNRRNRRNGIK